MLPELVVTRLQRAEQAKQKIQLSLQIGKRRRLHKHAITAKLEVPVLSKPTCRCMKLGQAGVSCASRSNLDTADCAAG
jgi:hypothetical protein